jgi:glycosyltransferase involved in cell wall biosynthesis
VDAGIDPLEHFLYTGWHEGRNPNAEFDTQYYLRMNTDVRNLGINPFVHYLTIGRSEKRPSRPNEARSTIDVSNNEQDQLSLIQQEFSKDYYIAAYPDVAQAGIDPLLHFFHTGWREGRNPNQTFDTKYYLHVNEDVRDAGLNPYWHYLVSGKAEGRLPRRPGGYRRQIVDSAVPPANRPPASIHPDEKVISSAELRKRLRAITKGKKGLIVSLSHDCYIRVIGGTQIFIADEQRRFNKLGCAYVHLSPQIPKLMLAEEDPHFLTRLVVDGKLLGLSPIADITRVLENLRIGGSQPSLLIVHCIMGFYVPHVINLCSALKPERQIFWLHDYSSICEGFNLLRNDAQFCGAPPPESLACRVCVYGNTRRKHLDGIQSLFAACKFDVVSPSFFTLNLWRKSTDLPRNSETIHPHWHLVPRKRSQQTLSSKLPTDPVAVAFVGFPSANKGWPIFTETVQRLTNDSRYQFFHFAARGTSSLPCVKFIQTEVTPKDRDATQRLLVDNKIDLVLILSPWPETFSFVAYEAIGAGAKIICLSDSGNVADLVRSMDCGLILPDGDALIDFFASGAAVSLIEEPKSKLTSYEIEQIGTTATIEGILALAGNQTK